MDNLSAKIIELSKDVYVIPGNTNVGVIITNENQKDFRVFKDGSVVCGEVIGRV